MLRRGALPAAAAAAAALLPRAARGATHSCVLGGSPRCSDYDGATSNTAAPTTGYHTPCYATSSLALFPTTANTLQEVRAGAAGHLTWYLAHFSNYVKNASFVTALKSRNYNSTTFDTSTGIISLRLYNLNNNQSSEIVTNGGLSITNNDWFHTSNWCDHRPAKDWMWSTANVLYNGGCDTSTAGDLQPSLLGLCYGYPAKMDYTTPGTSCNCGKFAVASSGYDAITPVWWNAIPAAVTGGATQAMWPLALDVAMYKIFGSALDTKSGLFVAPSAESLIFNQSTLANEVVLGATKNLIFEYNPVAAHWNGIMTEALAMADVASAYRQSEDTGTLWCGPRRPIYHDATNSLGATTMEWLAGRRQYRCNKIGSQDEQRKWGMNDVHDLLVSYAENYPASLNAEGIELTLLDAYYDTTMVSTTFPIITCVPATFTTLVPTTAGSAGSWIRAYMETIAAPHTAATAATFKICADLLRTYETQGRWVLVRDTRDMPDNHFKKPAYTMPVVSGGGTVTAATKTVLQAAARVWDTTYIFPEDIVQTNNAFAIGNTVQPRFSDRTVRSVEATPTLVTLFELLPADTTAVVSNTVSCGTSRTTSAVGAARTCLQFTSQRDSVFSENYVDSFDYYFYNDDFILTSQTQRTSQQVRWVPYASVVGFLYDAYGSSTTRLTMSTKSARCVSQDCSSNWVDPSQAELTLSDQCDWEYGAEGVWPQGYIDTTFGAVWPRKRLGDSATGKSTWWTANHFYNPADMVPDRANRDLAMCIPTCDAQTVLGTTAATKMNVSACTNYNAQAAWNLTQPAMLMSYFSGDCQHIAMDVSNFYSECMHDVGNGWRISSGDAHKLYVADIGWDTIAYADSAEQLTPVQLRAMCRCDRMTQMVKQHANLVSRCMEDPAFNSSGALGRMTLVNISNIITQVEYGCHKDLSRELMTQGVTDPALSVDTGYCHQDWWTNNQSAEHLLETKTIYQWKDMVSGTDGRFRAVVTQVPSGVSSSSPAYTANGDGSYALTSAFTLFATPLDPQLDWEVTSGAIIKGGVTASPVFRDVEIELPVGTTFYNAEPLAALRTGALSGPAALEFTLPADDSFLVAWTYKQFQRATAALCTSVQASTSCCLSAEVAARRRVARIAWGHTGGAGLTDKVTRQAEDFVAACAVLNVTVDRAAVGIDDSSWRGDHVSGQKACFPIYDGVNVAGRVDCGPVCIAGITAGASAAAMVVAAAALGALG